MKQESSNLWQRIRRKRQQWLLVKALMVAGLLLFSLGILVSGGLFAFISLTFSLEPKALLRALLLIYASLLIMPFLYSLPIVLPLALLRKSERWILVLRKFHHKSSATRINRLVTQQLAYLGFVFTLSDTHIKQKWYVRIPLLLGQLSLFNFRRRKIASEQDVLRLEQVLGNPRWLHLNWYYSFTKIFPIRTADDYWQIVVEKLLRSADIIVLDLSEVTTAIEWEIQQIQEYQLKDRLLLLVPDQLRGTAQPWIDQIQLDTAQVICYAPNQTPDLTKLPANITTRLAELPIGPKPEGGRFFPKFIRNLAFSLLILVLAISLQGAATIAPGWFGHYSPFPGQVFNAYLHAPDSIRASISARAQVQWPDRMTELSMTQADTQVLADFYQPEFKQAYLQAAQSNDPEVGTAITTVLLAKQASLTPQDGLFLLSSTQKGSKVNGLQLLLDFSLDTSQLDSILKLLDVAESETDTFDYAFFDYLHQLGPQLATQLKESSLRTAFQRSQSPSLRQALALELLRLGDGSGLPLLFSKRFLDAHYGRSALGELVVGGYRKFANRSTVDSLLEACILTHHIPSVTALAQESPLTARIPSALVDVVLRHCTPADLTQLPGLIEEETLIDLLYQHRKHPESSDWVQHQDNRIAHSHARPAKAASLLASIGDLRSCDQLAQANFAAILLYGSEVREQLEEHGKSCP